MTKHTERPEALFCAILDQAWRDAAFWDEVSAATIVSACDFLMKTNGEYLVRAGRYRGAWNTFTEDNFHAVSLMPDNVINAAYRAVEGNRFATMTTAELLARWPLPLIRDATIACASNADESLAAKEVLEVATEDEIEEAHHAIRAALAAAENEEDLANMARAAVLVSGVGKDVLTTAYRAIRLAYEQIAKRREAEDRAVKIMLTNGRSTFCKRAWPVFRSLRTAMQSGRRWKRWVSMRKLAEQTGMTPDEIRVAVDDIREEFHGVYHIVERTRGAEGAVSRLIMREGEPA